ncbi:MAG: SAM-dependent DNA methyltransferase, partial [Blastocatellia bacterium]
VEINPDYIQEAQRQTERFDQRHRTQIIRHNFFHADWRRIVENLPDPLLIVGNPPWVTNSQLGTIESDNLPGKTNFHHLNGLDALTGKSNFDISEWMLLRALEWINSRCATLAVLCKTAVARKVLSHAWKQGFEIAQASLYRIDAQKYFNAAVDACWLVVEMLPGQRSKECLVYDDLNLGSMGQAFGLRDDRLIADITAYESLKHLITSEHFAWRSGVKHDCAKVFELEFEGGLFRNGLDEEVELEHDFIYPMLKSSEIAAETNRAPRKWMLVTQRAIGEDTKAIRHIAPKTWQYLLDHADLLDARASSIYIGRPRFSVFGVGSYSFSNWKVGISGLYKKLSFRVVGPHQDKPVVFDDTCYFLACESQAQAETVANLLNSDAARRFISALIVWDNKRPITVDLLRQLNLITLAEQNGVDPAHIQSLKALQLNSPAIGQASLFK